MTKTNSKPLILEGRLVADEVLKKVKNDLILIGERKERKPGLAVILVGENPASSAYVKNKDKKCTELGIYSEVHKLSANTSERDLIKLIEFLNKKDEIDGILVQLPLPIHLKPENVIKYLDPNKDVDGLHPYNIGKLVCGQKCIRPCTPQGVIEILKYYSVKLEGMSAAVIGRSTLVGKPLSMLLLLENTTVTIAHSKTENIEEISRRADLLICAAGKPRFVQKHWVKTNAIVIDVGINKVFENGKELIVGDVDFESVKNVCQAITPVPGGVGPVTIAMLMANTLEAYKNRIKK